jgi:formylglycine-generating enzyme required for sulfatase activity
MDHKASSPASVFEKVLRAFQTGTFTYGGVRAQLTRLLATGASPTELLEILRRRELIEPLPEYAQVEVLCLLDYAIEQAAHTPVEAESPTSAAEAPAADLEVTFEVDELHDLSREPVPLGVAARSLRSELARPSNGDLPSLGKRVRALQEQITRQNADYETLTRSYERTRDANAAAIERATALAADLAAARTALESEQSRFREIERALAEKTASSEAARLDSEEALRESERYQRESLALRDSLAARDISIAQALHSLGERNAQLAALQQEHARTVPALEARARAATQLEADLQATVARVAALTAELTATRTAFQSEQSKSREIEKALAEKIASSESARARSEEAQRESERHHGESRTLRDALGDRDAEFAALQQEHARIVPALEARTKTCIQLEADLRAARAHAAAVALELKGSQGAAAALNAQLERSESHLKAARAKLDVAEAQARSYLEVLRTGEWRRGFDQNISRDLTKQLETADSGRRSLQAERDHFKDQVANLRTKLEAQDALIDRLRMAASADAERLTELQTAAQLPELEQAAPVAQLRPQQAEQMPLRQSEQAGQITEVESAPAAPMAQRLPALVDDPVLADGAAALGLGVSKDRRRFATLGLSAALLIVAAVAWFAAHHAPAPTPVPAVASAPLPKPGAVFSDCPTCPAMTVLPAGRFQQGSARAESGSATFEKPLHWVLIHRPIAMSTNVVTVDEFRLFVEATGRDMQGCDTYDGEWKHRPKNNWDNPGFQQTGAHPVTCVSWDDAEAYAQWLSAKTGHRYRLPSASEWEYAARVGAEAVQPWSPDGSGACANANVADQSAARRYPGWMVFACDDGYVYTAPVGSFKTNSFGLNDMLGNVFQWTEDCWHADYTGAPVDGSARTDGNCSERELRGGSWFSTPAYVRANYRNHFAADYRTSSVGIRLARDLEQ